MVGCRSQARTNMMPWTENLFAGKIDFSYIFAVTQKISEKPKGECIFLHRLKENWLYCRVLQLMNLTDSRLAQGGCEKLDLALLSFFEQFRKIYVGDQVQKTSKVRAKSDL